MDSISAPVTTALRQQSFISTVPARDSGGILKPSPVLLLPYPPLSHHHPIKTHHLTTTTTTYQPTPHLSPLRRAASGYAAALLDAALCFNSLESVRRTLARLMLDTAPTLMDPSLDESTKAATVAAATATATAPLVEKLVKVLIGKRKLGVINEVADEFERMCDELIGTTAVALVPAKRRVYGEEIDGKARTLKLEGGDRGA